MNVSKKNKKRIIDEARLRARGSIPRVVAIGMNGFSDAVLEFAVARLNTFRAVRFRMRETAPISHDKAAECVQNAFGSDYAILHIDDRDFILFECSMLQ